MPQIIRALIVVIYFTLILYFFKKLNIIQEDIQITYVIRAPGSLKKILRTIKKRQYQYTVMELNYQQPRRLPTDLKYVLKWTEALSHYSTSVFVRGQKAFIDNNCTFYNCYMTNDKSLLSDPRHFDAILFDVENHWDSYPPIRTPFQSYIFTASEPASMYPVCDPLLDSFYNATWTYKLDSTIPQPFFRIYDHNGTLVGPKADMNWITDNKSISPKLRGKLMYKKKMAAWFVSHCKTKSGREDTVSKMSKYLEMYNYTVDVYGWCGKLVCPKDNLEDCLEMLRSDYYFYLAFENSVSEDYVTEKVLYALNHYTVPVVYGGADYTRFLPPNSYIDASKMSPESVASLMVQIVKTPDEYENYFRVY
ncbi:hypothetical protein MSG28_009182 [Choristoneura fumiferana]|uniref:Uncharacterized protein n=1 Tax=Choristoneura fumiferana TaxID=7141 RepID=A0ACC0KX43_CHOFU|nr:hypothetical protein MSG28_009182 [Choristoneura fumiferana]